MLSNGAYRTRSVLKLDKVTALECILSIAVTVVHYWIMAIIVCLTCMGDFGEIFIFTTSKIVERVLWTLDLIGFQQISEKICSFVSSQDVSTQTDLSLHNVTDQSVPIIKLTHATDSPNKKTSLTSPSVSLACSEDFTFLQQNNTPKHDRSRSSVRSQDFTVLLQTIPEHELSWSSSKHEPSRSLVRSQDFPFLQQNNSSRCDRPQSSICSPDFTVLHQTIPKHDLSYVSRSSSKHEPSRNSSCSQNFTGLQQSNNPKHLNVAEKIENLSPATINIDDFKRSPINVQHISRSPVCTIHATPCSTNLKAKYSKVLVHSMSPEEISYLRRKWNNFKKNKKRSYLKMEPIFPSNCDDPSNERRSKKLRMMSDVDQKESVHDLESPEMNGCYKNLLLKLKSKLTHRNDTLVSYTNL